VSLDAAAVKAKAKTLGADLVGIARGDVLDRHPPDPSRPQTPGRITADDSRSVVVLARKLLTGLNRLKGHDDRHKQYSTELVLTDLEEIELKLVYFLEDAGFPSITVPPVHFDPRHYDAKGNTRGPLSLAHAAVEAGLGTLGLNLMLLTPDYGPRVLLGAVLTSAELEPDRPLAEPLCPGETCGRCLLACPADAIGQWTLDKARCAPLASPYGFSYLMNHIEHIVRAPSEERVALLKSKESFMSWQSILRGVGVYSGCTRCVDVCPVGRDYDAHLKDAQDQIAERTPEKEARLAEMARRRAAGDRGAHHPHSARWIAGSA
jgi:epoxyqueuosine reductase QueG